MTHSNYMKTSGVIFLAIALVHLWRIMNDVTIKFGTSVVPTWVSWAAVIIAGYLAYNALKKR